MRRPLRSALSFAFLSLLSAPLFGVNRLDVGAEYRLRGIQYNNVTYGSEILSFDSLGNPIRGGSSDLRYYSQRARVYMKGLLDPGIEIGAVIQGVGVSGSTVPLVGRYPKEDFTPFIENAYVKANEIHDLPVTVTLGRQPYVWGSGLLISDDGMGFDGIALDAGPLWGIRAHLFTAKAAERLQGSTDRDLNLAGLSYTWGIHNIKVGYVLEQDRSGTPYFNLNGTTNPVRSDNINRGFIDLQLDGRLEKGAYYSLEYAMQQGKAQTPGGVETKLKGDALTFEGGFDFVHPRYKRMLLAFVFMQGSGDNPESADDEKFNPSFGHKWDGLERSGYGEFFAATPYGFFNEERVMVPKQVSGSAAAQYVPYTSTFSGLRMFGFRGGVSPWEPFTAGLGFYIFTAREYPLQINDNELGRELDITASYTYAKRLTFGVRWGKFFPAANLNNLGSSRLMFEASGRF